MIGYSSIVLPEGGLGKFTVFPLPQISEGVTVVDATTEEEQCGAVSVVVGVAPSGTICSVNLLGHGTIGPQTLANALKVSSLLADIC